MITTKEELEEFLEADKIALGIKKSRSSIISFKDRIWKYQIIYRKYEYARNFLNKNSLYKLLLKYRFEKKSLQLGFSIPINTFDKGLSIAHYGTIVVNGKTKIGNNIFIGSGAKIIGDITIADYVSIGAGIIVLHSVIEEGITVAGVLACKVSDNNSNRNLNQESLVGS